MAKGILKITKTAKGKIIVALDRLNSRPPVPLSYVTFQDDKLNDQECEYESDKSGRITSIIVGGSHVFGNNFIQVERAGPSWATKDNSPRAIGTHPVKGGTFQDSFNLAESKLPRSVRNLPITDIDNFSLKYHHAARYDTSGAKKNQFAFFRNDWRKLKDGTEVGKKYFIKANYGSTDFTSIGIRQLEQAKALFGAHYRLMSFLPDWRLICGLSGGIYETNMTLHHVYGVPFIPASSIKGVVRSWIISTVFDAAPDSESNYRMVNAEYRALKHNHLFCDIFGSPEAIEYVVFKDGKPIEKNGKFETKKEKSVYGKEKQGLIVFMDGLPVIAPDIMPDIMNPHYPDWYNGTAQPTDYQNPNPIIFLTVSNKSRFQTCIGSSALTNQKLKTWNESFQILATPVGLDGESSLLDLVQAWIKKALSEHGIGAKTAVGYGILKHS